MKSFFSAQFFTVNRRRLRQLVKPEAPIVITAAGLLQRGGDTTFGFAQDASFWYLSGLDTPDVTLVIDDDMEYLIVPGRSASRQAFDGDVAYAPLRERAGIKTVYDEKAGWDKLNERLKQTKRVATLAPPPAYVERYGLYTNPARARLVKRLRSLTPAMKFIDVSAQLVNLRTIKQAPELAATQAAIDITIDSLKTITKPAQLKSYAYEYQVEAELSRHFRLAGADGHAFEPIIAGGQRACTLHNVANNGRLSRRELLLIDCGAEVEHYAADITRTFALTKPTARQLAVYEAVKDVQAFAFSLIKPGLGFRDYELQIEHYMGEQLKKLKLIRSINHANVRKFYPHSTSHAMGLNVHDVIDYDQPLKPGTVMTVEPGIYIAKEGIGIRIEDDVLVTQKGIKILTAKLPRRL